jgi:hypothetical protein
MKLDNGITVYGEPDVACCLQAVAEEFPEVWTNTDLINIPEDEWMRIRLKPGWENQVKKQAKRYPLAAPDEKEVDRVFDELHRLNRMGWATKLTPSGSPVFVAKKVIDQDAHDQYKQQQRAAKWQTAMDFLGLNDDGKSIKDGLKKRVVIDLCYKNSQAIPDVYPLPTQQDILLAVAGCLYLLVMDAILMFY